MTWHSLRHTCAASLICGWWGRRWRLKEVAEHLGHSDIKTTKRYAHLAESALKQAAMETTERYDAVRDERDKARAKPTSSPRPSENFARHARFEPATFGSGVRGQTQQNQEVSPSYGLSLDHVRALCQRFAQAVDEGAPNANELAAELAIAVGETLEPANRLVASVMAGGPFAVRRALELAELVLLGVNAVADLPATGTDKEGR